MIYHKTWMIRYLAEYSHKAKYDSRIGLLLAELAMQLHGGSTTSFYKMLKLMQDLEHDTTVHYLAIEMQAEIKRFHQNASSSM